MNHSSLTRREFLGRTAAASAVALAGGAFVTPATNAEFAAQPSAGGPWQIGCYTRPWAKYDYRTALDAIAEAGFKHIGFMTINSKSRHVIAVGDTLDDAARAGEETKKRGLGIPSIYAGSISLKARDAATADLRHLIDLCQVAGGKSLLMGGVGKREQYDVYYGAIADCCPYAEEKKIALAIKPHGPLNATGPELKKLVERVGHKNFRVWYDAGNIMFYSDGRLDPVDDTPSVAGLVTGWCIKDFQKPKRVDVTPGTGLVDFRAVLAQLKKGGFTGGPLVIETLSPGELPELLAEAKNARQFVESLVAGT